MPNPIRNASPEVVGFLASLRVEKAASEHTIRSYQLDLEQFFAWMATDGQEVPAVGGRISGRTRPHDFRTDASVSLAVGTDALAQVTHLTLRGFLAFMQRQEFSRRTIARKLSALRSFFKYLCRTGVLTSNPVELVHTPKLERKLPNFLYEEEVERLLVEMPDRTTPLGLRDWALLEVLYSTG
ncbi:MAG: site-specific integrase, partial [Mycobacterium leprae]